MTTRSITFRAVDESGVSNEIDIDCIHEEVACMENPDTIIAPKEIVVRLDTSVASRAVNVKLIALHPHGFTRAGIARSVSRLVRRLLSGELRIRDCNITLLLDGVTLLRKINVVNGVYTPVFN